jgi:hypothetical protein
VRKPYPSVNAGVLASPLHKGRGENRQPQPFQRTIVMSKQDFETINSDALVTATGGTTTLSNHQAYKLTQSLSTLTNTLNNPNSQTNQTNQMLEMVVLAKALQPRPYWA